MRALGYSDGEGTTLWDRKDPANFVHPPLGSVSIMASRVRDLRHDGYALVCRICERTGVVEHFLQKQAQNLVILMYHGVRRSGGAGGLTNYLHKHVEQDAFQLQMQLLASSFNVISMDEAVRCLREEQAFPTRSVVVTFDDGYRSNYEHAWPICRALNIPFTLYVVPSFIDTQTALWMDRVEFTISNTSREHLEIRIGGRVHRCPLGRRSDRDRADAMIRGSLRGLAGSALQEKVAELEEKLDAGLTPSESTALAPCTWDMLKEMSTSGLVDIGSHMLAHESVTGMNPTDAAQSLAESKARIEERVLRPCRHFAYPFGRPADFSDDTEELVRSAGYASAVTTVEDANRISSNVHSLARVGVYGHYEQAEFLSALAGVHRRLAALLAWWR